MKEFKQEYLSCWATDCVGFLHRYPDLEFKANLPEGHVIVDEEDWKCVRLKFNYAVYQMEKDKLNVIYIPIGKLSKTKAEEYLKTLQLRFNDEGYKAILIGVPF